jgi:DNA-binding response OmpR family regulator
VVERRSLRVLVVEDDSVMASMLMVLLENEGYRHITVVERGADAIQPAEHHDLVLLDNQLPDMTGVDLLPRLLAHPDPPSVIMVTGEGSEELAANALRLGAEDYLVKGPKLLEALPGLVERVRRNRMLRSTKAAVEHELVRAERLAAIGEMTVTLHHELNNPLMVALSEVELLLAGGTGDREQRAALQVIRDQMLRMRDIVKRAGDLQRADSTEYLRGLTMITLGAHAHDPAPGLHRGRAVLCVPDQELARATALLLRHAGFTVDRAETVPEAAEESARLDTTLVVLSVPGTPADPLQGFRVTHDHRCTLVVMVPGDATAARRAGADLALTLPFDPSAFIGEVLGAMQRPAP